MFGLTFRGEIDGVVESELEQLIAKIRGLWLTEHKQDGSHSDITADSLTLTASDSTGATGDVVADGDGTFDGNVTADADGGPVTIGSVGLFGSAGIQFQRSATNDWVAYADTGLFVGDDTFAIQDKANINGTTVVLAIRRKSGINVVPAVYSITPYASVEQLYLGENINGWRIFEVNSVLVRSSSGYHELGRTYLLGNRQTYTHAAGDFTADVGTWTVAAADVQDISWTKVGKLMTVNFAVQTSTTAGGPGYLKFALPDASTIANLTINPCNVFHGGTWQAGYIQAVNGETFLRIYSTPNAAAWPNEVDTIWARGQISFFVT